MSEILITPIEKKKSRGRPYKETPYDDIINIKWLFKNPEYTKDQKYKKLLQTTKIWKQSHREQLLSYHKQYNSSHDVYHKLAFYCELCHVQTTNKSQHLLTKKHISNSNALHI